MAGPSRNDKRRTRGVAQSVPGPPPSLQVAALCWRRTAKGALKVLLVTSRDTGRWICPKGWPMRNRSEAEAAAREAFEEAGVRGEVAARSAGIYGYLKIMPRGRHIPCIVRVYPLEVRKRARRFPESSQRRSKWFTPAKAARKVQEPELARLIRGFDPAAVGPVPPGPEPHDGQEQAIRRAEGRKNRTDGRRDGGSDGGTPDAVRPGDDQRGNGRIDGPEDARIGGPKGGCVVGGTSPDAEL